MVPDWKKFERHPISAEYADITGPAWESYIENLNRNGIVNGRKIILHEGKILDGWQLYRGCKELDIQPEFKPLPKTADPNEFVASVNDHRRHETQDAAMKRAAARRQKVIELRQQGLSQRAIADEIGVSQSTVRDDLDTSGEYPYSPESDSGKITGKDGKSYKAAPVKTIRCSRCTRVGPTPDCEACKELKKEARKKPKTVKEEIEDAADAEPEVPTEPTIEEKIKQKNSELESWCRDLMKMAATMPDDPWLQDLNRREGALQKLKNCCETIRSAKCHCRCPKCDGEGCRLCHNTGRVTKYALEQMK